jgi:AcrR family transcriptional regulator
MPSSRKTGTPDARSRVLLVDAAERLLLAEGYAAVTSRRVGKEAGITPQLVHYYFRSMDDLFLEVFRRRVEEGFEWFAQALAEDHSLRTFWRLSAGPPGARFYTEFKRRHPIAARWSWTSSATHAAASGLPTSMCRPTPTHPMSSRRPPWPLSSSWRSTEPIATTSVWSPARRST